MVGKRVWSAPKPPHPAPKEKELGNQESTKNPEPKVLGHGPQPVLSLSILYSFLA